MGSSGQQSGRAPFHHAPRQVRRNFEPPENPVKGTEEGYIIQNPMHMTALERKRSNEQAEKEREAAEKYGKWCLPVVIGIVVFLGLIAVILILLWAFTCVLGCDLKTCFSCKFQDWSRVGSENRYRGKASDCDDLWVIFDESSLNVTEMSVSGRAVSKVETMAPDVIGNTDLHLYWYSDRSERKGDGYLQLAFSHSATHYSGLGDFRESMIRTIPDKSNPVTYTVSGTDEKSPFYFPHLLLMNSQRSICMIADVQGVPMRWTLEGPLITVTTFRENDVRFYFEQGATPYQATAGCIAKWRQIHGASTAPSWGDDFIAGAYSAAKIEQYRSDSDVMPNKFILRSDRLSVSADGEDLEIEGAEDLTRWSTTLLEWSDRFNFSSGMDEDVSTGFYPSDNSEEFFHDYSSSSWPGQLAAGLGTAGYFLTGGTLRNSSSAGNYTCPVYPECGEEVAGNDTACFGLQFGDRLMAERYSSYDRDRAAALSGIVVESTASPASGRVFVSVEAEERRECFYSLLNLHMMGVHGGSCNLCGGTIPNPLDGAEAQSCYKSSKISLLTPYMVMVNAEHDILLESSDTGRYTRNNMEYRDKLSYVLSAAYTNAVTNNKPFIYPVAARNMSLVDDAAEGSIMIGDNVFFAAGSLFLESTMATIPSGHWVSDGGYETADYKLGDSTWDINSDTLSALFFFRDNNIYLIKDTNRTDTVMIRIVMDYAISVQTVSASFTVADATVTITASPLASEMITVTNSGTPTSDHFFSRIEAYFWDSCSTGCWGECKTFTDRQVLKLDIVDKYGSTKSLFDDFVFQGGC